MKKITHFTLITPSIVLTPILAISCTNKNKISKEEKIEAINNYFKNLKIILATLEASANNPLFSSNPKFQQLKQLLGLLKTFSIQQNEFEQLFQKYISANNDERENIESSEEFQKINNLLTQTLTIIEPLWPELIKISNIKTLDIVDKIYLISIINNRVIEVFKKGLINYITNNKS
ncbi:hypothetical protein [Mycoplasmopsis lipofaciens]|uniref:hypothetical protein n=1 Tax=Mycoplasmopsis lipofaciens TaxID=114884 RepID=UPI000482254E|nr:hypothetical protein [Mycoplasmopsis lipofaciens]